MGYAVRHFVVEKDDTLTKINDGRFRGVYRGTTPMPQYAGKKVRYLQVIAELRDRQPIRLVRVWAGYLFFDDAGLIRWEKEREANVHLLDIDVAKGKQRGQSTADAERIETLAKRIEEEYRWKPSKALLRKVADRVLKRG